MDINKLFFDPAEKPLDNLVTDGGFLRVFRTIGCVGDSLSSGEFVSFTEDGVKGWHDYYEYSWGQYIARDAGCTVYNFSRGGMTAENMVKSFGDECGLWDEAKKCQAYIIALGANDVVNAGQPVGSLADLDPDGDPEKNNPDTFAGWYARIIMRLKKMQPFARFFLVTFPDDGDFNVRGAGMRPLLYDFAKYFDRTYVIDLEKYGPKYDGEFQRRFYLDDHLNAAGYILTAKLIESYIDYIVRHNIEDFRQTGFIGKEPFHCKFDR